MTRRAHTTVLGSLSLLAVGASVLLSGRTADAQVYVEGGIYAQPQPVYAQPQPVYVQPQPTYVAQPAYQTTYYTHTGFFVRAAIGVGYGAFGYSPSGSSPSTPAAITLSGVGVNANLAAGVSVFDNFALHLDVSLMTLVNPAVTLGGTTFGGVSVNDFTNAMVGGGFTYYFMPGNFYVSGSLGLAYLSSSDYYGTTTGRSRLGFGVNALFGKEWLLGTKWNFGLAAQLLYSAVPDGDGLWNNIGGGIVASFTRY